MEPIVFDCYDFDKTIYRHDSTVRFYLYCLLRRPLLIIGFPQLVYFAVLLLRKKENLTSFKSHFFKFFTYLDDPEQWARRFWKHNMHQICRWYRQMGDHSGDVVISASPEFLLRPVFEHYPVRALIATEVDLKTGALIGKNCKGAQKVIRLQQQFPDFNIDRFFSDSDSDLPLARLARRPFKIKGEKVTPWGVDRRDDPHGEKKL